MPRFEVFLGPVVVIEAVDEKAALEAAVIAHDLGEYDDFVPAAAEMSSRVGQALRALQKLDEVESLKHRQFLIQAETLLGQELDLSCTADVPGDSLLSHNGDTCPIHEWLDEDDQRNLAAEISNES